MFPVRRFSTSAPHLKRILPAVYTPKQSSTRKSGFETNFPVQRRRKAWELAGEDKDTFFKKKYAHIHAKQKAHEARNAEKKTSPKDKGEIASALGGNTRSKRRHEDDLRGGDKYTGFDRHDLDDKKPRSFKRVGTSKGRDLWGNSENENGFDKKEVYSGIRPSPLSEFIYGSGPVLAALKAQRREYFSRLLVYNPKPQDQDIIKLAQKHDIKVKIARDKNELNILSNNGVHNGFVLETKPMLPQAIHYLGDSDPKKSTYRITEDFLGDQFVREHKTSNPHPFGVYLDEVSDPHNVGAIVRSAYFLGADFIVVSNKNCAPLSPVVSKTSVGALEFLPVYSCASPLSFLEKSREEGWTVVSAGYAGHYTNSKIDQTMSSKKINYRDLDTLLPQGPVLLVLGSEGEGLRTTIKLKSDHIVEIDSGANVNPIIDSLNVSVASALLIQKVLDVNE